MTTPQPPPQQVPPGQQPPVKDRCEQCHPACAACRWDRWQGNDYLVLTGDGLTLCLTHAHLRLDLTDAP